jgi:hypothetical protein
MENCEREGDPVKMYEAADCRKLEKALRRSTHFSFSIVTMLDLPLELCDKFGDM